MRKQHSFSLRGGAVVYIIMLAAALIFTQALRNTVSAVIFWMVLLLPVISLVQTLIGKAALQVYVVCDKTKTEKNTRLEYEVRVINQSPFSYPFVEAVFSVPHENGAKCIERRLGLSMIPFGSYSLKSDVTFKYRGLYEIGVDCLYISDIFRLFTIRSYIGNYANVTVFVRRLDIAKDALCALDEMPDSAAAVVQSAQRCEISNIRDYIPGDSMKSIHWKLSSKSQDLLVKEYNTNISRHVYVLCDFARHTIIPETENDEIKRQSRSAKLLRAKEKPDASLARELMEKAKNGTLSFGDDLQQTDLDTPGGRVKAEFESDIDEFCADAAAEITSAVIEYETQHNNECTVAWYDEREDLSVSAHTLMRHEDTEYAISRLSTAGNVPDNQRVSSLAGIVTERRGVTLRIVTANIDPANVSELSRIPAMFGGAGTGCTVEVLLFNPSERYQNTLARRQYTDTVKARLAASGVALTELHEYKSPDGKAVFGV